MTSLIVVIVPCMQIQLKGQMRDQHSFLKPHALKLCPLFAGTIWCLTSFYSDSSFLCSLRDHLALNKSPCSFFYSSSVSYFCLRSSEFWYLWFQSPLFQSLRNNSSFLFKAECTDNPLKSKIKAAGGYKSIQIHNTKYGTQ